MSNEDGAASSMNSTDTSQLLRELQALNQTGSSASASYSGTVHSAEIGGSGDATITQLMQTMYNPQPKQKIVFTGSEDQENSFGVYGREVDIYVAPNEGALRAGSNKVKIKNLVNHSWESRYYYGNLVAVHRDRDFIAFSLKSKSGGAVRVLNNRSSDRKLIKGFTGNVVDVAFAHSTDAVVAAVDDFGMLLVYVCDLTESDEIITTPLLQLEAQDDKTCMYHRVVWCPYWPDDGEEADGVLQDSSKVLAYTQGEKIELMAVDVVTRDYGAGPLNPADIESGKITLVSHTEPIVEAVFSPDGSALATASVDGEVKFFQIDWNYTVEPPTCLHQWQPHNGQPLSFFAFLDDLKNMSPDAQFWKFAVTGCNKNQELKVWSCETWNCLQTVRFMIPPDAPDMEPLMLKAGIDLSARYILLSDRVNMVVYVLQLYQDAVSGRAHISSVTDFPLTQACLSFAVVDASTRKFKPSPNESHLDEITTGELEEDKDHSQNNCEEDTAETTVGVQIHMFAIHPRALQDLLIRFRPESSVSLQGSAASVSHDGISLRDGLSDVSVGVETSFAESEDTGENMKSAAVSHPQPKLLSPEAFTISNSSKMASPSSAQSAGGGGNTTVDEVLSSTSSFTHVTGLTGQNAEDLLLSPASSADQSTTAGTSRTPKSPGSGLLSPKSPGSVLSPTALFSTPQNGKGGVGVGIDEDLTPTNIPLPPEEEDELATPKSSHHSKDSSQLDALEAFFKPHTSSSSLPGVDTGTFEVENGTADTSGAENSVAAATDTYDENDQEVAEVLGEDVDKSYSSTGSATTGGVAGDYQLDATSEDTQSHKPWPRPPDVPAPQTEPDAPETLPQALDEATQSLRVGEGEDDYSEDQNEAEVEEEIEEVIEEAEDDEEEEELEVDDYQKTYPEVNPSGTPATVQVIREVLDPSMLSDLQENIRQLSVEVSQQQEQMRLMQQLMAEQHEVQMELQKQHLEQATLRSTMQPTKDLEQQLGRVQNVVASRVERTLSTALQKETKLLHDRLSSSEARQASYQESLQKAMTQALSSTAQKSLETVVKNEFKNSVNPAIGRSLEQMKSQMHTELSQKMTATDAVIKDQIGKLVRQRQTTDAIGQAVTNAMHGHVQGLIREVFDARVIPAVELASRNMMTQINASFQAGTTEYLGHLRKQLEKVRQEQATGRDPLIAQLSGLVESFKQSSQQLQEQTLSAVRSEAANQIKASLGSFQDQLNSGLRAVIREEVGVALREQGSKMTDSLASYLRSGAGTPVPGAHTPDVSTLQAQQDQIKQLVNRGKLDKAFQMALSAANLELTVYTCELVDPTEVFGQSPCPLTQPVLLSLIQQLSAELSSSFNTKIKFLTEAVTTLDTRDPVIHEHIPVVLEGLVSKLRTYQASHPPNRDVRLLLMAATSLLAS